MQVLMRLPGIDFCDTIRDVESEVFLSIMCQIQQEVELGSRPVIDIEELNTNLVTHEYVQNRDAFGTRFTQEDSAELFDAMQKILNHEVLEASGLVANDSHNFNFFGFELDAIYVKDCSRCNGIYRRKETLPLKLKLDDLTAAADMVDLIVDVFAPEQVTTQCDCDEINGPAEKYYEVERFPRYLSISADRFMFDYQRNVGIKRSKPINVPLEFNFPQPWLPNDHVDRDNGPRYKLHGFVQHNGASLAAGHYIAKVKDNDKWYDISDTHVQELGPSQHANGFPGSAAYILLYIKQ